MKTFRLLKIFFKNTRELLPIHKWQYINQKKLDNLGIKIIYIVSNFFAIIFQRYDNEKELKFSNVDQLNKIFDIINSTPISNVISRNDSIDSFCGLPKSPNTNHCFQDMTHRTCCMLGGEARKYADQSGNPIGKTSEKAFYDYYGFYPDQNTLTPWCTCIGSKVCSFYAKKFNDGTHVKYINSINKGKVLNQNEQNYSTITHLTPGIY